jgi:hypothetical protein
MRLHVWPRVIRSAHQPHTANSRGVRHAANFRSLIFLGREEGQDSSIRCFLSERAMESPNHSARPRIAWATKLSTKRAPNRTLAPLADATVGVSLKLMPAAATAISAKSIIQPRIFCSSGTTAVGVIRCHTWLKHFNCQDLFAVSSHRQHVALTR